MFAEIMMTILVGFVVYVLLLTLFFLIKDIFHNLLGYFGFLVLLLVMYGLGSLVLKVLN